MRVCVPVSSSQENIWFGVATLTLNLFSSSQSSKGKETLWEVQFFVIYLGFLGREVISAINQTIYMCLTCYSLTL